MAIKMSHQARIIKEQMRKKKFFSLNNSYHGETLGALSLGNIELYKEPYKDLLFDSLKITNIPYVSGIKDPLWENCYDKWIKIEKHLNKFKDQTNAIIIEPLVQGAGGMKIYSKDFLKRISCWCSKNDVYLIADEIMTGIARTGKMFAFEYAQIKPDFLCISKGLTSGVIPFSVMMTSDEIYEIFYDKYENKKNFLHSHTHSGNTLGCSVALKVLEIIENENVIHYIQEYLSKIMQDKMLIIHEKTKKIKNIRSLGALVAADLVSKDPRQGFKVYKEALKLGALLRPIGNTIYWTPPLNTKLKNINSLKEITEQAILNSFS